MTPTLPSNDVANYGLIHAVLDSELRMGDSAIGISFADTPNICIAEAGARVSLSSYRPRRISVKIVPCASHVSIFSRHVSNVVSGRSEKQMAEARTGNTPDNVDARFVIAPTGFVITGVKNPHASWNADSARKFPCHRVSATGSASHFDLAVSALWIALSLPHPAVAAHVCSGVHESRQGSGKGATFGRKGTHLRAILSGARYQSRWINGERVRAPLANARDGRLVRHHDLLSGTRGVRLPTATTVWEPLAFNCTRLEGGRVLIARTRIPLSSRTNAA